MSSLTQPLVRAYRCAGVCCCTFLLFQFVSLYMSWPKQAVFGGLTVLVALLLNRGRSPVLTSALMLLSIAATLRYGWWRVHAVANYFADEANHRISLDAVLMLILLIAEIYTAVIMILGFMQTSQRLCRRPVPLPADEELWPHVDVLIPTYNEPLSLVRYTVLAAINMDYPPEKLHVYLLDDGKREDFRAFCDEAGVGYVVREQHVHAKAGNINHALTLMHSPLVSVFDCDHVPTRSFLQMTVGWFMVEERLAMLQTPHFFYSPDPFERNLLQYKCIPNEGELFYGIIQDGNDLWNSTFFCGSCAVIRRAALDDVGGIATETVTEDAHTSLRMQKRGWHTAYMNMAQAAGLATETLAGHVGQRVRWARGMIQILRTENPLLSRGLDWKQRLCYFNAMMHFMYAVPRLIFLVAPLAYMLLGRTIIPGYWLAILAYSLPHLIVSYLTNSRVQGTHRHSFWNEIYETVLAPYILAPTMLALFNPKLGQFNVTAKGTTLSETHFDRKIAAPTTWLLLLNFAGLLAAPYRYVYVDPDHLGVIVGNLCWICFNIVILGVAAAVAHEQKQRRCSVRIPVHIPVVAYTQDGAEIRGTTQDMSVGGAALSVDPHVVLRYGDKLRFTFPIQTGYEEVTATVVFLRGGHLRVQYVDLSLEEQETLTRALYSRADCWVDVRQRAEPDRPLLSFLRICRLATTGWKQVALGLMPQNSESRSHRVPTVAAVARIASVLLLMLTTLAGARVSAQSALSTNVGATSAAMWPTAFASSVATYAADALLPNAPPALTTRISLREMGVSDEAELRGPHSTYALHFVLPHTMLPCTARLTVGYHLSAALAANAVLKVWVNKTLLSTITPETPAQQVGRYRIVPLTVPTDLLIRDNDLMFEFAGNGMLQTSDKAHGVLASIANASELTVDGDALPFHSDIATLPLPLFDSGMQNTTNISFVFPAQPDRETLQAAGVVASWFGILASSKPIRFTAVVGPVPSGNAVVFVNRAQGPALLPDSPTGSFLQIAANPSDSNGTVLVVGGDNGQGLLQAAQALAMMPGQGDSGMDRHLGSILNVDTFRLPPERNVDDAPRWLPTDRLVHLGAYAPSVMSSDGSKPLPLYFRVPPDLYYGETENLNLLLRYRYDARPLAAGSALRTYINGMLINEAPLQPGKSVSTQQRTVHLPVAGLRPFTNTLLFGFDFASPTESTAQQQAGELLRNSSLDLRGAKHWAQLPNLELFSNAGFPFTQYADLSHTVVMMPKVPSAQEITLLLHLLSHFGRQTGYPALRVEISGPDDLVREDRDYLILGTFESQPAFNALQDSLPVSFDNGTVHVRPPVTLLSRMRRLWNGLMNQLPVDQQLAANAPLSDAVIEGIRSPYAPDRSIVVLALRDNYAESLLTDSFLERSQSSDLSQSVSLLRGGRFVSYTVDVPQYHVGTIGWYTAMRISLTRYAPLLLLAVTLCTLVLGQWIRQYLASLAEERLEAADREPVAI